MHISGQPESRRESVATHDVPMLLRAELWLTLFVFAGILKGNAAIGALDLPDLTALFGLLSAEALLLESWLTWKLPWPDLSWVDLWLGLCCIVVVAGAVQNAHADYAVSKAAQFVGLAVAASYGVPRCVARVRGSAEEVTGTVVLVMSVLGTAFALAAFLGVAGASVVSFGGTYQSWGYFAGASAICTLALFAEHEGVRPRLFLCPALALQVAAVGACGARGPFVALAAALVLTALGLLAIRPKTVGFLVSVSAIAILGIALALAPKESRARVELLVAEDKGASVELRESSYKEALDMFAKQPLFGAGTGNFAVRDPYLLYPHNVVLEVMSEDGILGVLVFSGFVITATWRAWRAWRMARLRRARSRVPVAFLLCIFFGLQAMVSGDIANRELFFVLGLLTAASTMGLAYVRPRAHIML